MTFGSFRLNTLAAVISAAVTPPTLSFIASAGIVNANSNTTGPSVTYQTGDLIIYIDGATNGSTNASTAAPTLVTPTNFTSIVSSTTGTSAVPQTANMSYWIATSGATGTFNGMAGTFVSTQGGSSKIILVYRPSKAITSVTSISPASQSTQIAPTSKTVANASASLSSPYIGIGLWASTGSGLASTSSVTATRTQTASISSLIYSTVKTFESLTAGTSIADSTLSMTDGGTNTLAAAVLQIT
jgi:hypothetical protein